MALIFPFPIEILIGWLLNKMKNVTHDQRWEVILSYPLIASRECATQSWILDLSAVLAN